MIDFSAVIGLTVTFFLITNPIGNSPAILTLVKDFPLKRQKYILMREGVISLLLALFFQYFGEAFLSMLMLKDYTISLCGGTLLFIVALDLIFPDHTKQVKETSKSEPFFVPIATPLLAGPGLVTVVMLYSRQIPSELTLSLALVLSWFFVSIVLLITPYLQKILGDRGIVALEQFMGMVVAMMSVEMIVKGVQLFLQNIN